MLLVHLIQVSSRKHHKWNLSLFKRCRLTYPDGNITYSVIYQGSLLFTTRNTTKCTTVIFHYQHILSFIWGNVPIWTCFPATLSYKQLLKVQDAKVFIFIGVTYSSILINKILFFAQSVDPTDLWCNNCTTCPLHTFEYGRGFLPNNIQNPLS